MSENVVLYLLQVITTGYQFITFSQVSSSYTLFTIKKYILKATFIMLNNLMTRYLGLKKYRKILLQINSSYFSKAFLHHSRNKTGASL